MWIEICKDTFEISDFKSLNFLHQILSWYPSESFPRYNVFVDTNKVLDTDNFKNIAKNDGSFKELLDVEFNYYITTKPKNQRKDYYVTYKKEVNCFNVEESIRFFNQPVSIILENNKNDSSFILAIINYFGKLNEKNKAKEHIDNGWLKFENAGGCSNIPNFIEGFLNQFENISLQNSRPVSDYFRGLIIMDSDKEFESQSPKYNNILVKLERLGILEDDIHVLKKRTMENYLPDEAFEELLSSFESNPTRNRELIKWIKAYIHLTSVQKDYINIAKGKLSGTKEPVPQELKNLFPSTSENFSILDDGFKYKKDNFKNEFPKLFLNLGQVNKYTLEQKSNSDELQIIMGKIYKLL